jgi:hypothetical protein
MKLSLAISMAAALASLPLSGASPARPANPRTLTTRILAIGTVNPVRSRRGGRRLVIGNSGSREGPLAR